MSVLLYLGLAEAAALGVGAVFALARAPRSPSSTTRVRWIDRFIDRSASSGTSAVPAKVIGEAVAREAAPFARPAVSGALRVAGNAVETGTIDIATPATPAMQRDAVTVTENGVWDPRASLSEKLSSASDAALGVSTIAVESGIKLSKLRGKSERQQRAIFGATSVGALESALTAIPAVGAALSAAVGVLAGTYEGKKVVREVGRVEEQGYVFQKNIFNGRFTEAFGGARSAAGKRHSLYWKQVYAEASRRDALKTPAGAQAYIDAARAKGVVQWTDQTVMDTWVRTGEIVPTPGSKTAWDPTTDTNFQKSLSVDSGYLVNFWSPYDAPGSPRTSGGLTELYVGFGSVAELKAAVASGLGVPAGGWWTDDDSFPSADTTTTRVGTTGPNAPAIVRKGAA